MKRIVFVDDEPMILQGLENSLRAQRKLWKMSFVTSGEEALALLAAEPVDVVVTDMRMPRMDGATLLKHVHERFPKVVRIVLSGHAELEATLRTISVAHQYLSKPCDAATIREVVERACALQTLLDNDVVRTAVNAVDSLPSSPRVYLELTRLLAAPDVGIKDVAKVLERDIALSAKLLQLVNSAFFGLRQRATSVERAAAYLGASTIQRLVLSIEATQGFGAISVPGFSMDDLQSKALRVGKLASSMFERRADAEDAFTAGILHDLGSLILATKLMPAFVESRRVAKESEIATVEAERRVLGVTHAELGAYLLGLWGLPYPIVEAVAFHHMPDHVEHTTFGLVDAVHIASSLVDGSDVEVVAGYAKRFGLAAKVATWQALAEQLESAA